MNSSNNVTNFQKNWEDFKVGRHRRYLPAFVINLCLVMASMLAARDQVGVFLTCSRNRPSCVMDIQHSAGKLWRMSSGS